MTDWQIEFFDQAVEDALRGMPKDIQARFQRIVELIAMFGLESIREPYVKHLEGKLWEMRVKGRDGIARAIYVTATPRRVIILTVFRKKTQKTPKRELDLARQRAREVT